MLEISDQIRIPFNEFQWSFVRSGGPGGQNVNKVASKAVLRWDALRSPSLPEDVKARLLVQQKHRLTKLGELVLTSQRYRDQERKTHQAKPFFETGQASGKTASGKDQKCTTAARRRLNE